MSLNSCVQENIGNLRGAYSFEVLRFSERRVPLYIEQLVANARLFGVCERYRNQLKLKVSVNRTTCFGDAIFTSPWCTTPY